MWQALCKHFIIHLINFSQQPRRWELLVSFADEENGRLSNWPKVADKDLGCKPTNSTACVCNFPSVLGQVGMDIGQILVILGKYGVRRREWLRREGMHSGKACSQLSLDSSESEPGKVEEAVWDLEKGLYRHLPSWKSPLTEKQSIVFWKVRIQTLKGLLNLLPISGFLGLIKGGSWYPLYEHICPPWRSQGHAGFWAKHWGN